MRALGLLLVCPCCVSCSGSNLIRAGCSRSVPCHKKNGYMCGPSWRLVNPFQARFHAFGPTCYVLTFHKCPISSSSLSHQISQIEYGRTRFEPKTLKRLICYVPRRSKTLSERGCTGLTLFPQKEWPLVTKDSMPRDIM